MNTYLLFLVIAVAYYLINIFYDLVIANKIKLRKVESSEIDLSHFNSKPDDKLIKAIPTKVAKLVNTDVNSTNVSELAENTTNSESTGIPYEIFDINQLTADNIDEYSSFIISEENLNNHSSNLLENE